MYYAVNREGMTPIATNNNMNIEITKEAAWKLIGNDEKTWHDYQQTELAEITIYHCLGMQLQAIHNYVANVTQYYLRDINA